MCNLQQLKTSPFSRTAAHIFVSPGDAPGAIMLNVVWMEREFDAYNCLAACAHLSITVSEIQRDIREKIGNFSYPLVFDAPVRGFPSEYRHPLWYEKTRMVSLPDGEKNRIYLYSFWRNSRTWRIDRRTDRHRVTAYTALMHMHRAVKIDCSRLNQTSMSRRFNSSTVHTMDLFVVDTKLYRWSGKFNYTYAGR